MISMTSDLTLHKDGKYLLGRPFDEHFAAHVLHKIGMDVRICFEKFSSDELGKLRDELNWNRGEIEQVKNFAETALKRVEEKKSELQTIARPWAVSETEYNLITGYLKGLLSICSKALELNAEISVTES